MTPLIYTCSIIITTFRGDRRVENKPDKNQPEVNPYYMTRSCVRICNCDRDVGTTEHDTILNTPEKDLNSEVITKFGLISETGITKSS